MTRQEYLNKTLFPLTLLNVSFGMYLSANEVPFSQGIPLLFVLPVLNMILSIVLFKE